MIKREQTVKYRLFQTIISCIIFVVSVVGCSSQTSNESIRLTNLTSESDDKSKPKKSEKEVLKERIEKEIAFIQEKGLDDIQYHKSTSSLGKEVSLFNEWAIDIYRAKLSEDNDIERLGKQLEDLVKEVQERELPLMRKAFYELIYHDFWLENIDVQIKEEDNSSIQFTGHVFYDNKNKQATLDKLRSLFKKLRFQKVSFRTSKYDDSIEYFDLKNPLDTKIIAID